MSEFEKINAKVKSQKAWWRRAACARLGYLGGKALCISLALTVLMLIGFISKVFFGILVQGIICWVAFKAGWICRDIKF